MATKPPKTTAYECPTCQKTVKVPAEKPKPNC